MSDAALVSAEKTRAAAAGAEGPRRQQRRPPGAGSGVQTAHRDTDPESGEGPEVQQAED